MSGQARPVCIRPRPGPFKLIYFPARARPAGRPAHADLYKVRRVADVDTRKRLQSSSTSALITPSLCHTVFFVAAQRAWNTLPSSVTVSETLGTFKHRVKHIFLPFHSLLHANAAAFTAAIANKSNSSSSIFCFVYVYFLTKQADAVYMFD